MATSLVNGLGGSIGFGETILPVGDDNSSNRIDITSVFGSQGLNFFGHQYTALYVNNNGTVTFDGPLPAYTPTAITAANTTPIIAPFWGDVDTRRGAVTATPGGKSTGSDRVYYDLDAVNGVLTVTWDDVAYYNQHGDKLNAFQLQLVSLGNGDFDMVFRYEDINWTTGDASGGSSGLGGTVAVAGYTAGDGVNFFQLPQSGSQAGMLSLPTASNRDIPGVFIFDVHAPSSLARFSVAAASADKAEGNSGQAPFTFNVSLDHAVGVAQTVTWSVTGSGALAASAADFGGVLPSGTLTFAAGETSKLVTVAVTGDTAVEANETFTITLSAPTGGAVLGTRTATGNIRDDDAGGITVAHDDAYIAAKGTVLHVAASSGVLFNDVAGSPVTATLLAKPTHGSVVLSAGGGFDYTPAGDGTGIDQFTYRASGANGTNDAKVSIYVTPVTTGDATTLSLPALTPEQQIAATYAAFFGRAADAQGFQFWLGELQRGLPTQGPSALTAIAGSFGIGNEAKGLYPFLGKPFAADDAQIGTFVDSAYNNLFGHSPDAAGLAYWTGQIKATLAAGQFAGSVLVNMIGGTQAGPDSQTLLGKLAVALEFVAQQQAHLTPWDGAADTAAAAALLRGVTSDPQTVLIGINQADQLAAFS